MNSSVPAQKIPKYTALVIQPHVIVAEDRSTIQKNLERVCNLIDFGVGYTWELPTRLIVLPEYFLQGVTIEGVEATASSGMWMRKSGMLESLFRNRWKPVASTIGNPGRFVRTLATSSSPRRSASRWFAGRSRDETTWRNIPRSGARLFLPSCTGRDRRM